VKQETVNKSSKSYERRKHSSETFGGNPLQWRLQTLHKAASAGSLLGPKYRNHELEHLCLGNECLLTRLVVFQGFEMFFLNLKYLSGLTRSDARF